MSNVSLMIRKVLVTMNDIEVKGRNNLDKLLGCMMLLENAANEADKIQTDNGTNQDRSE